MALYDRLDRRERVGIGEGQQLAIDRARALLEARQQIGGPNEDGARLSHGLPVNHKTATLTAISHADTALRYTSLPAGRL